MFEAVGAVIEYVIDSVVDYFKRRKKKMILDDLKAAQARLDKAVGAVVALVQAGPGDVITAADAAPIIADINDKSAALEVLIPPATTGTGTSGAPTTGGTGGLSLTSPPA